MLVPAAGRPSAVHARTCAPCGGSVASTKRRTGETGIAATGAYSTATQTGRECLAECARGGLASGARQAGTEMGGWCEGWLASPRSSGQRAGRGRRPELGALGKSHDSVRELDSPCEPVVRLRSGRAAAEGHGAAADRATLQSVSVCVLSGGLAGPRPGRLAALL